MFDIGNVFGSIAKAVLPSIISAEFPFTALVPGLNQMIANVAGDMLEAGINSILQQNGSPQFMINDAMNAIKQAVQTVQGQNQCSPGCQDQAQSQFGDLVQSTVGDYISEILKKLKTEIGGCGGKGGKGGAGGAGGAGGSGGTVTLRELAALLGKLEEQEAKNLKTKVDAASKALGESKGQQTQGQYDAMEAVKAEAQIQSTLSSMISEVIKNFGQAMQSSARG